MQTVSDKFKLEYDTNKTTVEAALFPFQQVHWILTGYRSKIISSISKLWNYRIRANRFSVNMCDFSQFLKHRYFEVLVNHKK